MNTPYQPFANMRRHIEELHAHVYPQPIPAGGDNHTKWTEEILSIFLPRLPLSKSVLDVGCGQGLAQHIFEAYGKHWTGVTLGEDYRVCKALGLNVVNADMHDMFMFEDQSFDLVYIRHTAEHTYAPPLLLMELHRLCIFGMIFIVPIPKLSEEGIGDVVHGQNHWGLLPKISWEAHLKTFGFNVVWENNDEPSEVRFYCQRVPRPRPIVTNNLPIIIGAV